MGKCSTKASYPSKKIATYNLPSYEKNIKHRGFFNKENWFSQKHQLFH